MVYGPVDGTMTELAYDCRNRLVRAGNTAYEYDAENTRTAIVTQEARTEYVTDKVSGLPQVLETHVTCGETEKTTICVYGSGLLYEYDKTAGSILVHHYNNIGSTTALTDESGTVVEQYVYGAYGELSGGDTTRTAYLYNGMYGVQTDENGLYYMRARYYNTDIKRFINRDVVKGSLQNSQSLNRYSYVQGNPISLTDQFGLSPFNERQIVHGVLDFIGVIPGIGDVADITNAVLYLREKKYKKAAKYVRNITKHAGTKNGGENI